MLASLDVIYRIERQWRLWGVVWSLLGVIAFCAEYRRSGFVLMVLSCLCQLISWRAMRAAQRAHDARTQRAVL
jgi:hypothetical protein